VLQDSYFRQNQQNRWYLVIDILFLRLSNEKDNHSKVNEYYLQLTIRLDIFYQLFHLFLRDIEILEVEFDCGEKGGMPLM